MTDKSRIIGSALADSDDIRGLQAAVENEFEPYREVHFSDTIMQIQKKWPLLAEVQVASTGQSQNTKLAQL